MIRAFFRSSKVFCKQRLLGLTAMALISQFYPNVGVAEEAALEEVVVTGSRIARDGNLTSAQPVQGFDAEEIVDSGEFALIDVISEIPALAGSLTQEMTIDSNTMSVDRKIIAQGWKGLCLVFVSGVLPELLLSLPGI